MTGYVAAAEIDIAADRARVWHALTDPREIERYFFGTKVETDWRPGSPITWRGDYQGTPYSDKGSVVEVEPGSRLVLTHFSPSSGVPDEPPNYHTVTYQLEPISEGTQLSLRQDNNGDQAEADRASKTWQMVLGALKEFLER